jgi:hypothetical protein
LSRGFSWRLSFFLLSTFSSDSPSVFELAIAFVMNGFLAAFEHIERCDVADGGVESLLIVMIDEAGDCPPRIVNGEWS